MAKVEVVMPQMGVIEWSKSVGDTVDVDETLLEIATDKVDSEVPSPEAGTLVEILVEEGDTIEVGQTIAIIETDASAVDTSSNESAAEETQEVKEEPQQEEVVEEDARSSSHEMQMQAKESK